MTVEFGVDVTMTASGGFTDVVVTVVVGDGSGNFKRNFSVGAIQHTSDLSSKQYRTRLKMSLSYVSVIFSKFYDLNV